MTEGTYHVIWWGRSFSFPYFNEETRQLGQQYILAFIHYASGRAPGESQVTVEEWLDRSG